MAPLICTNAGPTRGIVIPMSDSRATEDATPETLTLDEAFRAAHYLTEAYVELEKQPDVGLVLFLQYLKSDPARWDDWKAAVRTALSDGGEASPLA